MNFRDRLLQIILINNCILAFKDVRNQILQILQAAHQGTLGVSARANHTVYWNAAIRNLRANCVSCNHIYDFQRHLGYSSQTFIKRVPTIERTCVKTAVKTWITQNRQNSSCSLNTPSKAQQKSSSITKFSHLSLVI